MKLESRMILLIQQKVSPRPCFGKKISSSSHRIYIPHKIKAKFDGYTVALKNEQA